MTDQTRNDPAAGAQQTGGLELDGAEYVRVLDDAQLLALAGQIDSRISALVSQGVQLPLAAFENHHLTGLLEGIAGRDLALTIREWHLTWVDQVLDQAEAAVRTRLLESGVFEAVNGSPRRP